MSWEKVKLGDLYEVHNGLSKGGKFFGSGYPFLSFSTVFNNWFIPQNIKDLVQSTDKEQESYSIKKGDVFITRTSETADELGMSCVALKDYPQATYNGFCKRLRPIKSSYEVNPRYIGYYLRTSDFRGKFLGLSGTMTTRASLRNEDLLAMEILLPPLKEQKRIADILSAYDDLIENNQKQIKLLEEAAQRLYKQWFIDLRYPGHETTKIVDGIPQGWRKGCLADIVRDVGINEKKENRTNYSYYLPIDCLPKKSLTYTDFNNIKLAESSLVAFSENDIVFGAMRPYFHKVVVARDSGLTRSTCFVINTLKQSMWSYAVMLLFDAETIKYATKISVGTTMPYVRWKDFISMPILIPHENVTKDFNRIICPIIDRLKKISKQNINLKQARDRLLPKLMNGELEI